jgi:CTP synthase (UTP-ammonia lyase)
MTPSSKPLRIGLIGDFNIQTPAHRAIPRALTLAAEALGQGSQIEITWIATSQLTHEPSRHLSRFTGLWCAPGSPYSSMQGALRGIQYAREKSLPFLGTCGGFQHALIEYARHVLRLHEADHAETHPAAPIPLICRLPTPLDRDYPVRLLEDSRLRRIYNAPEVLEPYHCKYGFAKTQEAWFHKHPVRFSGRDRVNEVRAFELDDHPFFVGTLYQPERTALKGNAHPLVTAFLQAILQLHHDAAEAEKTG